MRSTLNFPRSFIIATSDSPSTIPDIMFDLLMGPSPPSREQVLNMIELRFVYQYVANAAINRWQISLGDSNFRVVSRW